jgi:translation elongation factor EF-1alpha
MVNIVVFGKAHSGKSTLIGYIHSLQNKISYSEKKLQSEMGNNYDPSMFYAYQLDDSKNERNQQIEISGSHFIHLRKITLPNGQKITLIDTPGREHLKREKMKGAFYGDIGIFCLELNDVASDEFLTDPENSKDSIELSYVMSTLMLWSCFSHKKIIVALTKSDLCNYSEEIFKIAKAKVQRLCSNAIINPITIIPIAITVEERTGHNIEKISKKLNWYSGQSLCDVMGIESQKVPHEYQNNGLLFCIDRKISLPKSQAGKIWRIKIIQGQLSNDDSITLSPVLTDKKDLVSVEAKVKTIREDIHKTEKKSVAPFAGPGSIIGLDLYEISIAGRRIQKKDFDFLYTTCGFNTGIKFDISDKFTFSITSDVSEIFGIGREYSLIWFGRAKSFSILRSSRIEDQKRIIIAAQLITGKITLPLIPVTGEYYFKSLIVKDENSGQHYGAELISIGG